MAEDSATGPPEGRSGTARSGSAAQPQPETGPGPVLAAWRATLAAVRLPNTLLVAGDVDAGSLDLTHAHPSGLATLLAGRPARLSSLVREPEALALARRRVRAIRSAAGVLALDRGIQAGYLAAGVARWRGLASEPRPGSGPPWQEALSAPVLLRGCSLRPHGAGHDDYDLDLDAAAVVNPLLLHRLHTDHGVIADGLALAGLAFGPDGFNPAPVFEQLALVCETVPGFRIEPSLLVGTFTAGSGQLLADLERSIPAITAHRLLGRGVASPPGAVPAETPAPADLAAFDAAPPEGTVLDLDPAQRAAVEAALAGRHVAIEGPPGSGLTQTLVATAAAAVARGRRVLLVTPQRGTADAFVARLAEAGLAGAVLNVHDGAGDRAGILAGLGPSLEAALRPERPVGAGSAFAGSDSGADPAGGRGLDAGSGAGPGSGRADVDGSTRAAARGAARGAAGDPARGAANGAASGDGAAGRSGNGAVPAAGARPVPSVTGSSVSGSSVTGSSRRAAGPGVPLHADSGAGAEAAARFQAARDGLLGAGDALHEVREPWGVSGYDAMVALSALMSGPHPPRTRVRLPLEVTRRLDTAARERLRVDLRAAAELGAFTLTRLDTRWLDARVRSQEDVDRVLVAAAAARSALPTARSAMSSVAQASGLPEPESAGQWRPQLELLLGIRDTLDVMLPAVYEQPLGDLIRATGPQRRIRSAAGEPVGVLERRMLRRRARSLVRPGVQVRDVHGVLRAAQEQRERWVEATDGGGWPRVPTGLAAADAAVRAVESMLGPVCAAVDGTGTPDLLRLPLDKLEQRLADLATDPDGLKVQPERTVLLDRLREAGLGELIADLQERRAGADDVDGELDLAWWTSVLEAVIRADQRLARHQPGIARRWSAELREADQELLAAGLALIRERMERQAREVAAREPLQARWLRAEVHRGHRSEWPADLFRRAGDLVGALRPIWVMSPDTVARVLPVAATEPLVDLVMVDDAGQVGMPEAAAALARGRQIVAAGDRLRLPPSTGGPSVLEFLAAVTRLHRLDRDHRARDGRLLTPLSDGYPQPWALAPGTAARSPLSLHLVDPGEGVPQPGEDVAVSPDAEVARVLQLVSEHAARRPAESLLVVTLGMRHAERIEDALRQAVVRDRGLAAWLDVHWTGGLDEPFLVRPVHRIAGLERDAVIVSVGMAKRPAPSVVRGFGVLDGRFGTACLRAAFSRARRRTMLTCCFTAKDLSEDGDFSAGMRMLRAVLASAASGSGPASRDGMGWPDGGRGDHGPAEAGGPETADALVADLRERLEESGMPVGGRIPAPDRALDLAIGDPLEPGRWLVAVEFDGPQYAACRSVRLRDRQRAQTFERAGWTYLRVSAMDLFCDPAGEVERIRDAWRAAGGLPASVVPSVVLPTSPAVRNAWPDRVATGLPISAYSDGELDAVAWWVVSDGMLRSQPEVAAEVRTSLGLPPADARVETAVAAAAGRVVTALSAPAPAARG